MVLSVDVIILFGTFCCGAGVGVTRSEVRKLDRAVLYAVQRHILVPHNVGTFSVDVIAVRYPLAVLYLQLIRQPDVSDQRLRIAPHGDNVAIPVDFRWEDIVLLVGLFCRGAECQGKQCGAK